VGVNRICTIPKYFSSGCPHARGGEPGSVEITPIGSVLSPRTWG